MQKKKYTHMQLIALGFLILILTGTVLLMLPIASRAGQPTSFLTALFTATSSSCVTGLVLVDTATYWSLFGQIVIITMIQIGGLGFMTVSTLFLSIIRHKFGLREREVLAESISATHIDSIVSLTHMILCGTAIIEGIGAALLSIRFIPEFGVAKGIYYSVFHSISAFCNAGFDLMGFRGQFRSLVDYAADPIVNITIMSLIVIGGIGFLVWRDIYHNGFHWSRYHLHTKLVFIMTAILIFGGALCFFFLEYNNLEKNMPVGEQILTSLFSSVTARTAGFNTTDTAMLTPGSKLLTIVLMFIGGSPGSTAGGIKTTSFAVIFLSWALGMRGEQGIYIMGRKVSDSAVKQAILVFCTNLFLTLLGVLLIVGMQGLDLVDVLFEAFSAIGTVGMSTGVTRALSPVSCCIIIFLMYCGRVGSVSYAISLAEKRPHPPITYPEESITIG